MLRPIPMFACLMICSLLVLPACRYDGQTGKNSSAVAKSSRDHLLGWYELQRGRNTYLIPVLKRGGQVYYTLCNGIEAPLKPCPEGLEWAPEPSSMTGTTFGHGGVTNGYYLRIVDAQLEAQSDNMSWTDNQPLNRVRPPQDLPNPTAPPPQSLDDFVGWYQPVWLPYGYLEIRKEDGRYTATAHEFGRESPETLTQVGSYELTPLTDRLGFAGWSRDDNQLLVYNTALKRYEFEVNTVSPAGLMPLVRVLSPSPDDIAQLANRPAIFGIPAWH